MLDYLRTAEASELTNGNLVVVVSFGIQLMGETLDIGCSLPAAAGGAEHGAEARRLHLLDGLELNTAVTTSTTTTLLHRIAGISSNRSRGSRNTNHGDQQQVPLNFLFFSSTINRNDKESKKCVALPPLPTPKSAFL